MRPGQLPRSSVPEQPPRLAPRMLELGRDNLNKALTKSGSASAPAAPSTMPATVGQRARVTSSRPSTTFGLPEPHYAAADGPCHRLRDQVRSADPRLPQRIGGLPGSAHSQSRRSAFRRRRGGTSAVFRGLTTRPRSLRSRPQAAPPPPGGEIGPSLLPRQRPFGSKASEHVLGDLGHIVVASVRPKAPAPGDRSHREDGAVGRGDVVDDVRPHPGALRSR